MNRFDYCFDIVLGAEGGFVDHASDKGGRTNYGITQKTLDEFQLSHSAPTYDVKDITVATAKSIYYKYWAAAKCDQISPPPLDLLVFDCAINSGASRAIKLLQQMLGVVSDGVFGSGTKTALDALRDSRSATEICENYLTKRKEFYRKIVDKDQSQSVFLKGWYNRITKLEQLVDKVT